jgi:hypothetical protein
MRQAWSQIAVWILLPMAAWSDVTVVHHVTSTGYHGMGASEAMLTRVLKDHTSRDEQKTKFTGKVLGTFVSDKDRVTLTRLDEEVIQMLNVAKKTYTETTFKELREAREKAMSNVQEDAQKNPEKGPEKPPTHKITKASFTVTPSSEQKTINGYSCKKYVLKMLLDIEDLQTHQTGEMRMDNILWTTTETASLKEVQKEELAFAQLYLKKLGLDTMPDDMRKMSEKMMASLSGAGEKDLAKALSRMGQEMKKIQGYPIVTQMDWYLTGSEPPTATQSAPEKTSEDTGIDTSNGVGGALGSLAGHWASKKAAQKMQEHQQAQAGKPAFSIVSELQSASTAAVPDEAFVIPAGYKKVSKQ